MNSAASRGKQGGSNLCILSVKTIIRGIATQKDYLYVTGGIRFSLNVDRISTWAVNPYFIPLTRSGLHADVGPCWASCYPGRLGPLWASYGPKSGLSELKLNCKLQPVLELCWA